MTALERAEAQLRDAYLAELVAMWLILFFGLFWLASLIADYWRAKRNLDQVRGEQLMRRGFKEAKRLGLLPDDLQ